MSRSGDSGHSTLPVALGQLQPASFLRRVLAVVSEVNAEAGPCQLRRLGWHRGKFTEQRTVTEGLWVTVHDLRQHWCLLAMEGTGNQ